MDLHKGEVALQRELQLIASLSLPEEYKQLLRNFARDTKIKGTSDLRIRRYF